MVARKCREVWPEVGKCNGRCSIPTPCLNTSVGLNSIKLWWMPHHVSFTRMMLSSIRERALQHHDDSRHIPLLRRMLGLRIFAQRIAQPRIAWVSRLVDSTARRQTGLASHKPTSLKNRYTSLALLCETLASRALALNLVATISRLSHVVA